MQCPNCGSAIEPGTAFCPRCGADVPAGARASTPPPPKQGMSGGVVVGIVAASLVVVFIAGIGGFFVYRSYMGAPSQPSTPVIKLPKVKLPSISATLSAELGVPSTRSASSSGGGAQSGSASSSRDGLVTDAEARAVVSKFWDLRIAHDIAGSKALCDKNMLASDNASLVNDPTWVPESFTIAKTTPDQAYIHVTTVGRWPSGDEPTILSVWRDPSTGTVLIDAMLDPQTNPGLLK